MSIPEENHTSRRQFLKTSTTAILSGAIAAPAIFAPKARAVSPGDTLKVGLIGCGRGQARLRRKTDGRRCAWRSRGAGRRRGGEEEGPVPRLGILLAVALSQTGRVPAGPRWRRR